MKTLSFSRVFLCKSSEDAQECPIRKVAQFGKNVALFFGALVFLFSSPGFAEEWQVFYTTRQILSDFFSTSQRVTYVRLNIDQDQRRRIEKRLGSKLGTSSRVLYSAITGGRVDGYALVDQAMGRSLPFHFAMKFDPAGIVQRVEILRYRSPYGDEVRSRRFLDQFVGKSLLDPLQVGRDIDAVSGATINAGSLSAAIRQWLVIFDEIIGPGQKPRTVNGGGLNSEATSGKK